MKSTAFSLFAAVSVLVSACGGGDDAVQEPVAPTPPAPVGGTGPTPIPPSGLVNTITSARLSTCPEGFHSSTSTAFPGAAVFQCLAGSAYGFVSPGLTEPCTLTVTANGVLSLEAGTLRAQMSAPFGSQTYNKAAASGGFYLLSNQPGSQNFAIDAGGTPVGAGNVFTGAGGALASSVLNIPGVPAFTCLFEIK